MSLSYKIIKGACVQDKLLQVLPLKRAGSSEDPASRGESRDVLANFQAWAAAQAEETLRQARDTADAMLRKAQADCEHTRQQAYQSAFEQGLREGVGQGYREGLAKAEQEAAAIRRQAREVLRQAEEVHRRMLESLEQEMVQLATEIADKLLSAHLALDNSAIINIAAESIRLVSDRLNLLLFVNPSELELVEGKKEQLLSLLPAKATLQVVSDASITPGGCLIETEQGRLDATMEKRKEELLNALYGRE